MKTLVNRIKECIERKWDEGYREFIIYPFGETGLQVKHILNDIYGVMESYIIDNHLYKYNPVVRPLSFLENINCDSYCLIMASINSDIYQELKSNVKKYFQKII